jgi:hypothetical protein
MEIAMSKANHALTTATADIESPWLYFCRYDINTVLGLVEALGGAEAVAKDLGVSPTKVADWCITGDIPNGWHLRLLGRACALRKSVSPVTFGLPDNDPASFGLAVVGKALMANTAGGGNA